MITNLIENSIKYSKAPAYITVSVSQHGKNAILEVADKGLGIPDNEKEKYGNNFTGLVVKKRGKQKVLVWGYISWIKS